MSPLINFTNPGTILIALVLFILVVLLGKETKKSTVPAISLLVFLAIIAGHAIEYAFVDTVLKEAQSTLAMCMSVDFVFILLSFISYLWIDDIETKAEKKKSIDDSLEWFWTKV